MPRVAPWSSGGDPSAALLKPDVVAPATGILGAVPREPRVAWDFVTGTSAATAYTAGVAATLLAEPRPVGPRGALGPRHHRAAPDAAACSPPAPVGSGPATRDARAGLSSSTRADYRAWLEGRRTHLNTPSILLSGGQRAARRTVTNVGRRALYFSSRAVGFRRRVSVTPAAVRLDPGESATYVVDVAAAGPADDGYVVWRGASGTATSIPVQISR